MPADERAELVAAADAIGDRWPRAAARLRALATPPAKAPDPRELRRMVLRRIARTHFLGEPPTVAARLIATRWADWTPDPDGGEVPGTLEAEFARLARVGVARIRWRAIHDDLTLQFLQSPGIAAVRER